MVPVDDATFSARLIAWQRRHGRHDLPWQGTRDPYRVWLSEVMLQQTQVAAVIPYYLRFLERFPTVEALAAAEEDEVLRCWSGLGYYARGRNLHAAARIIAAEGFPRSAQALAALPGVGRTTAAAIAVFAFGERAAILDGNVKRVLARYHGIAGWPGDPAVQARLWQRAEALLPSRGIVPYTQGLMDLGATVCVRAPRCDACPLAAGCVARRSRRTGEIPAARPRRALPLRTVRWLVMRAGNRVLLERRPSSGLWGGLWAFPEAPRHGLEAYCRTGLGVEVSSIRALEHLEHGFTHFRLRIQPLLCSVRRAPAAAPNRAWLGLAQAAAAAVPAPVRVLLLGLRRPQQRAQAL